MDDRIRAIRDDDKVGHGSCTSVDECLTDDELKTYLDEDHISSPDDAVRWAYKFEGLFLEQCLNTRNGDDDDPELALYKNWTN